jgi:hypothetical protein
VSSREIVWQAMPSLNRFRHSFGAAVFSTDSKNQVIYVYGGITGKIENHDRENNYNPLLASPIERLVIGQRSWEDIKIAGVP